MGRSGSHLLLDYLLINNRNLTVKSCNGHNIFEELHPNVIKEDLSELHIEEIENKARLGWKFDHDMMQTDLTSINEQNKNWCLKSFGHQPLDLMLENYPYPVTEIFLFRENVVAQAASLLISEKANKYHWSKEDKTTVTNIEYTEDDCLHAIATTLRCKYILLTILNTAKKKNKSINIVTFNHLTDYPNKYFTNLDLSSSKRKGSRYGMGVQLEVIAQIKNKTYQYEIESLNHLVGASNLHFY